MEYFVDEMPRDCASCKHYHMNCADGCSCSKLRKEIHPNFSEGIGYRHQDCPLQSLADYTKQVRNEVCVEIKDLAGDYFELSYCDNCGETNNDDVVLTGNDLTEILDQIQGKQND